jgi:cytochrome P450
MVFQESMRLSPAIWAIERRAREADQLGEHLIPAGATVITSPYVMHRHPKYWDAPETFDPLRFLPEREKARPPYAYFPFGGGPRRCVGLRVGMLEGQLMLATLAQGFTVRLKPGHAAVPGPRLNMPPKFGLPMILEPRRRAAV